MHKSPTAGAKDGPKAVQVWRISAHTLWDGRSATKNAENAFCPLSSSRRLAEPKMADWSATGPTEDRKVEYKRNPRRKNKLKGKANRVNRICYPGPDAITKVTKLRIRKKDIDGIRTRDLCVGISQTYRDTK